MIQVWTGSGDGHQATGVLDRNGASGSTFAYTPPLDHSRAVSLTMPSRLPSWSWPVGLAPIFEMNLPEGALRDRLQRQFGKATGRFDDLDLLSIPAR